MSEQYTPTTEDVREDFAYPWEGFTQDRERRLAAFDRWLREHDAALIESLADALSGSPTSDPGTEWAQRDIAGWLREQAQKRRDGSE